LKVREVESTEWAPSPLTPFVPTDFLDISACLDRKVSALECYAGELAHWPHPRSGEGVRALARWRGTQAWRLRKLSAWSGACDTHCSVLPAQGHLEPAVGTGWIQRT
jgi:hypothetical protein